MPVRPAAEDELQNRPPHVHRGGVAEKQQNSTKFKRSRSNNNNKTTQNITRKTKPAQ